MSARTAPQHRPAELTFHDCDPTTGIVHFTSASAHDAARVNTTGLDTATGATFCDCKAAECGRVCWHRDHIAAAWLASPAMAQVRWLTDAQLYRHGRKHRLMVDTYAARTGRSLTGDTLALVAARHEWRRRVAALAVRIAPARAA